MMHGVEHDAPYCGSPSISLAHVTDIDPRCSEAPHTDHAGDHSRDRPIEPIRLVGLALSRPMMGYPNPHLFWVCGHAHSRVVPHQCPYATLVSPIPIIGVPVHYCVVQHRLAWGV